MVNHPNRSKRPIPERRRLIRRKADSSCAFCIAAQRLAESIKKEIKADSELLACTSFEELHEHCDANMLGNLPHIVDIDKDFRLANAAIEIVDEWLSTNATTKEEVRA